MYNVEAYVRASLQSVLDNPGTDLEVIVVEDRSTDGSLGIVHEMAGRDSRVHVVELAENAGLGNARNVGMDHARGEWILFLDSDDELTPGSLSAMLELGQDTDADVVMFDYARLYWNGERARNKNAKLFADGSGPVTTLERPELLDNLNVAWNKLYRRSFLDSTDLRFPTGIYEDIPWTYPVLLIAGRIALLDRVALLYRQRREGSILRSASPAHMDVFDQYDRLFDWLGSHEEHAWAHKVLHEKMVAHLLTIFDFGERRLPRTHRRAFYEAMSATVARHAPPDYEPTGRLGGVRRRAVVSNRYQVERAFEHAKTSRRTASRSVRRAKEAAFERKGRLGTFARLTYYRLQLRRPIDKRLAVFSSYWYAQCSGNPKAISDAARQLAPEFRRVWLVEREALDQVPESEEAVVVGTWKYYEVLATAAILVDNSNFPNFVRHRKGATHLQTKHGTPLKSMGLDVADRLPSGQMDFDKLMSRVDRWDFILSSNRYSSEVWARAFPARFETLEYGYPRNDLFFGDVATISNEVRDTLGIDRSATVVLYAPTFRDHRALPKLDIDLASFGESLPDDMVLLVRAHYLDEDFELDTSNLEANIIDVSRYPDVQKLAVAADVLVTDYSSIMFDYANLGRPIVVFAPDWETYCDVRGVYFDILESPPGRVVRTQEDLEAVLIGGDFDDAPSQEALAAFREKFCEFDDGHAAERVVQRLFLGHPLPTRYDDLPKSGSTTRLDGA